MVFSNNNDESIGTHYEWLSRLNINDEPRKNSAKTIYRRTSIICTIGSYPLCAWGSHC